MGIPSARAGPEPVGIPPAGEFAADCQLGRLPSKEGAVGKSGSQLSRPRIFEPIGRARPAVFEGVCSRNTAQASVA